MKQNDTKSMWGVSVGRKGVERERERKKRRERDLCFTNILQCN